MMYFDDGRQGIGSWLLMIFMMIVFWGGLAAVGYVFLKNLIADSGRPKEHSDPARLLDERLARGEIEPEDYERRRALIR